MGKEKIHITSNRIKLEIPAMVQTLTHINGSVMRTYKQNGMNVSETNSTAHVK